jgi:hypothetical protein
LKYTVSDAKNRFKEKIMQKIVLILTSALVLSVSFFAHAEVYKWKDKKGVTQYSDTPPLGNVRYESIKTNTVVLPTVIKPVDAEKTTKKNADKAKEEKQAEDKKQAEAQQKTANCNVAKANAANLKQGGRIYRMNEKGEREYIDDKTMNDGIKQAEKEIKENC